MATAKKTKAKKATTKKTTTKKVSAKSITKTKAETKSTKETTAKKSTRTKTVKEVTPEKATVATKSFAKPFAKSFAGKRRKKTCKFCDKGIENVDYKEVDTLKKYLNHHLKIIPARVTGTCSKHQRRVSNAIKRARVVALIPFVLQD